MAQLNHVSTFDAAVRINKAHDHLLLLDRIKPCLAYIGGLLPRPLIYLGAQGVGAALAGAVGFHHAGFHQLFQGAPDHGFGLLHGFGQVRRS